MNPTDLLDLAERAARGAGVLLRGRFGRAPEGVSTKSTPTDLVSDADRAADDHLRSFIASERPDDGFITEEAEDQASSSGMTWVLDPLDATVNYLFGIPWWCVSVAVEDAEGVIAGAVFHPMLDEMYSAARGAGAALNGTPISVSERTEFSQVLIATGFAYDPAVRAEQVEVVARVVPTVRDIRRMGSAALDLCAVGAGRVDGYYESGTAHWDTAAGSLIVQEAGGTFTDLGESGAGRLVVATNGLVHDELVDLVTN